MNTEGFRQFLASHGTDAASLLWQVHESGTTLNAFCLQWMNTHPAARTTATELSKYLSCYVTTCTKEVLLLLNEPAANQVADVWAWSMVQHDVKRLCIDVEGSDFVTTIRFITGITLKRTNDTGTWTTADH